MRVRRTAAALAVAAAITAPVAAAGIALAGPAAGSERVASYRSDRPAKANFSVHGTITQVSTADSTLSVKVTGGAKDLRGRTVTIDVPSNARIEVNDRKRTLASLAAGYRVEVSGVRSGGSYTAARIEASRRHATTPTPAVSPTAIPSASPSQSPSASPTKTKTASPDDSPDDSPTDLPSDDSSDDDTF